jgi:antitoxin (DNA-binding transcriptional repressor) of toxin-antitoxin stability system
MKSLAISEFKAKCIAELRALQEGGGELVITLRGRPLARVLPIRGGRRRLGAQQGHLEVRGDLLQSNMEGDFGSAEVKRVSRRGNA